MGYFKIAIKNVSWSGGLRVFIRVLTFVKLAILARILTPTDFGLIAIASLVLAFLEIATETGINVFFIQEKRGVESYLDTAFVVSIFRGITISLVILVLARPVSVFFNSPGSLGLIYLIAAVPFVRGFINPSIVQFRKKLQFSKEFIFRSAVFLIDTLVAISVSFALKSAVGLVYGMIAGAIVEVIITQLFISPKPKFKYETTKLKKIIKRGKWITMSGVFNYLFENVDDMAVGRIMVDSQLGIYQMAYKISSLPITEISTVVNRVTLPVYVNIRGDLERLKRAYLKSLGVTFLVIIPIGLTLFLWPDILVMGLLGDKWLEVVEIVRIMSFFGVIRGITLSTYPLFLSLKKQEIVSKITLTNIVFLVIGLLFLVKPYGIVGAGVSAVIGAIAGVPVSIYYLYKVFSKKTRKSRKKHTI
ncbi:lipopolysaccharide biosynthesis protein [Candidatus Microgenomates bacterium]|nr:lipopolysaccharide biosynthesis protein [Candidatus Microgenomates bacterium]